MFKVQTSKSFSRFLLFSLSPLLLFSSLFLFTLSGCDKQEKLYGDWNLQTVLMNDEPLNDSLQFNVIPIFTYYTFFYENALIVKTYTHGQEVYSSSGYYQFLNNSTIKMTFSLLYKRYEIKAKIKKLTQKELNLEYEDNGNTYFLKLYAR